MHLYHTKREHHLGQVIKVKSTKTRSAMLTPKDKGAVCKHAQEPYSVVTVTEYEQGNALMAREFAMFFIVISIWFHWIFVILWIFLMLIQQKRRKSTLSFGWQEISYMEGNRRRLLQIKSIGATFLKRALSTGASE